MNQINLIPPRRRRANARGTKLRAWAGALGGYAALLAAAGVVLIWTAGKGPTVPQRSDQIQMPTAQQRQQTIIEEDQKQVAALRATIEKAQQANIAAASVTDAPDWSRLFEVVALRLGDDVVLGQCSIAAAQDAAPTSISVEARGTTSAAAAAPKGPVARHMVLHLSGYGRSQAAVADFVLCLEELGLFEQVQLLQTARTVTSDGTAVSFSVDCPLKGVMQEPS